MTENFMIFGIAVGLVVAWMLAVSTFIEPEMQRSHWGGDPGLEGSRTRESEPKPAGRAPRSKVEAVQGMPVLSHH